MAIRPTINPPRPVTRRSSHTGSNLAPPGRRTWRRSNGRSSRSSLKFADAFPEHEKAAIVLGAAADDLYGMKEYEQARTAATRLIEAFPVTIMMSSAMPGWSSAIPLTSSRATARPRGRIYEGFGAAARGRHNARCPGKQSRGIDLQARGTGQCRPGLSAAADHFLRVGRTAPTSKIRPTAEYDAAAALIQLKDWGTAASVLAGFRTNFPDNPLQPEVTKKIAHVYRENNQLSFAAKRV